MQFNSTIISTIWDDSTSQWQIKIRSPDGTVREDTADILINGSGYLNRWRWPDIPGLHSFQGTLVHSAAWDPAIDWTGKRVALIGNGSSGIQILPQVQPGAKHVVSYTRNPTWIASSLLAEDGKPLVYDEEHRKRLRENPGELRELRRNIEHFMNQFFRIILSESPEQGPAQADVVAAMKQRLGGNNTHLHEKLIPKWKLGCRRLTLGEGYLEALQEPNVTVEISPIQEINDKGIVTTASTEEVDIIICATGFDVSFRPSWELAGKNGIRLADQWRESPEAYFGICAPNMPNYFIINGPNIPAGHGNLISAMDWMVDYILCWCRKIAKEDIKLVHHTIMSYENKLTITFCRSIQVRQDATDDYNAYTQEFMKRTVWASGCRSWYKNGKVDGKVTAMYAGSVYHYKELLESFRSEDFVMEYRGPNRFRFMGNGLTIAETKGENLADYM